MSDLIPKTANVRDAYSAESVDSTYANRMFDLWLAKYKAKVIAKTEERIIELLKPLGECEPAICGKGCRGQHKCVGWAYRHAIRLIKGENK